MADFYFDLSRSLGISSIYTVLGNGWVRERTQHGVRDSFLHPVYDMSLSVKYNGRMEPVSFGQKVKLSEGSEEREFCLDDGKYVYRVRKINGTLVPDVSSINISDFRNPRKKIKYKRPDIPYKALEFTSSLDDPKQEKSTENIKSFSCPREYKLLIDRSFAIVFMQALYYHPTYSIKNIFRDLVEGKVDNRIEMDFFREFDTNYFCRDVIEARFN